MFGFIGSLFSFLGGIAPAVATIFTAKTDSQTTEFVAMTETERSEYAASQSAQTAANSAKALNNASTAAHILTYMFGVPAAIHWGMTMLTATYPQLGFHTDPLSGQYAQDEHAIAMSFFILAPTLPLVNAISARLMR